MEFESPLIYLFLGLIGLVAGFVDSIAGGGGLIALPALLSIGLPPHVALGTNKLQSCFGSFTAALNYARKGLVDFRGLAAGIGFTACGAVLGTFTIQIVSTQILQYTIPLLLLAVFIYILLAPNWGAHDSRQRLPRVVFYGVFGVMLGFYDGFFGPGTGSFWALGFVGCLGLHLKKATAHTKITNFTSNLASLAMFWAGQHVVVPAGIAMGLGQVVGAFLGSRMVILKGVRFVRMFLLIVMAITILRLIFVTFAGPDVAATAGGVGK